MASDGRSTDGVAAAIRSLPEIERAVFVAMLDERATYAGIAARLGIGVPETERVFAAALVRLAEALDAPPPQAGLRWWLRRIAAVARLARRVPRR